MIARTHHCPQYRTEISSPNHHRKSIHLDHPGSVSAMAERGGPVTEENVYTAFGDPVPASAPVIMAAAQQVGYVRARTETHINRPLCSHRVSFCTTARSVRPPHDPQPKKKQIGYHQPPTPGSSVFSTGWPQAPILNGGATKPRALHVKSQCVPEPCQTPNATHLSRRNLPPKSRARRSGRFDLHHLPDSPALGIKDHDPVVIGHHRIPVRPTRERCRPCAVRHRHDVGQRRAGRGHHADDNQCDDGYEAKDHHGGERGYQPPQKLQLCRFGRIFGAILIHGNARDPYHHRAKSARAP